MQTFLAPFVHRRGRLAAILAVGASLGAPISAHAATNSFLTIGSPGFKDSSLVPGEVGAIELHSWSWGLSNTRTITASGLTPSTSSFSQFKFTKFADRTSPAFLTAAGSGKLLGGVHLDVMDNETGTVVMRYCLQNPIVVSDSLRFQDSDYRPAEDVVMAFSGLAETVADTTTIKSSWDSLSEGPLLSGC